MADTPLSDEERLLIKAIREEADKTNPARIDKVLEGGDNTALSQVILNIREMSDEDVLAALTNTARGGASIDKWLEEFPPTVATGKIFHDTLASQKGLLEIAKESGLNLKKMLEEIGQRGETTERTHERHREANKPPRER